jgi:hypothetical protein
MTLACAIVRTAAADGAVVNATVFSNLVAAVSAATASAAAVAVIVTADALTESRVVPVNEARTGATTEVPV